MKRVYTISISSRQMITFYLQKRMKPLEKELRKSKRKIVTIGYLLHTA